MGKYSELIQNIVAAILREGLVDGVLAFTQGSDASDIVPSFITEEDVSKITIASYQPCSLVKLAVKYGEKGKKLAIIVRPCDARAAVELAKRKQLDLENLYLIGIECYGVVKEPQGEIYIFPEEMVVAGEVNPLNEGILSPNCLRCEYPIPTMADISCGIEKEGNSFVVANTEKGRRILTAAGIASQERTKTDITPVKERALKQQEKEFGELKGMHPRDRLNYWLRQFDKCIKCYGCRNSCPVCYCEDCYLEPQRFLIEKEEYPPEKLFHITRLIHIADSCVNCGQCEAACPMEIPVSKLHHMMTKELSLIFNYEPGMDVSSLPPVSTITEEDLAKGGVELG